MTASFVLEANSGESLDLSASPYSVVANGSALTGRSVKTIVSRALGQRRGRVVGARFEESQHSYQVLIEDASRSAVITAQNDLARCASACNRFGGVLRYTPNGLTTPVSFNVLGVSAASLHSAAFEAGLWTIAPVQIQVDPLGEGASSNSFDGFDSDTITAGDWTAWRAGSASVASGVATTPSTTGLKGYLYSAGGDTLADVQATVKVRWDTLVANKAAYVILKGTAGASGTALVVRALSDGAGAGTLAIGTVDSAGSFTSLKSTAITTLATATYYYVRGRVEGNTVYAEWFTSRPTPSGTAVHSTSWELAPANVALWGSAVEAYSGVAWNTQGTGTFTFDDFSVKSMVYRAHSWPGVVTLNGSVPGTADARLAVSYTNSGAGYPVWLLYAFWPVSDRRVSGYSAFVDQAIVPTAWWRHNDLADPTDAGYDAAILARGDTLAYWELGDASGAPQDSSGNGYHMDSMQGNPTYGNTGPILGSDTGCIDFDGTGDFTNRAYDAALNPAEFTIAAWIMRDTDTGAVEYIFGSNGNAGGTLGFSFRVSATDLLQILTGTGAAVSNSTGVTTLSTGVWYFAVASYDGTTRKLYLNGVLEDSDVVAYSPNVAQGTRIGALTTSSATTWNGKIGRVSLHDAAWTDADVAAMFVKGRRLIDAQGLYHGGMVGSGHADAVGAITNDTDHAIDYNGSTDRSLIPYSAVLNAATFSISGWIRRDSDTGGVETIIDSRSSTGTTGYAVAISASDKLVLSLANGGAASDTAGATSLTTGTYHHFAATYDGTTSRVYLNGVLDGSGADALTVNASGATRIGCRYDATLFFNGKIDELKYRSSTVLTASEIAQEYLAGLGAYEASTDLDVYGHGPGTIPAASTSLADLGSFFTIQTDTDYRSGISLQGTGSLSTNANATYNILPHLFPPDEYGGDRCDVAVIARLEIGSGHTALTANISLYPEGGTEYGEAVHSEYRDIGKPLTLPSSGTRFRTVMLGTIPLRVDKNNPRRALLYVAFASSGTGVLGIDDLWLVPARRMAHSRTDCPDDENYQYIFNDTNQSTFTIDSDLVATKENPANTLATANNPWKNPALGLVNNRLYLPSVGPDAPPNEMIVIPSDLVVGCTDSNTDSNTKSYTGTVSVEWIPAWDLAAEAS